MNRADKNFLIGIVIFLLILLVLITGAFYFYKSKEISTPVEVACTMEAKQCPDGSYVGRSGPKCEFTACPSGGPVATTTNENKFDQPIVAKINEQIVFPEAFIVVLKEINDSRCKPGVVCIWQGELSARFEVTTMSTSSDLRLGTVNNKKVSWNGYTFSLVNATENTATIIVSKNQPTTSQGRVSGFVHMGPVCPVERNPPDPNCADRPYTQANIVVINKDTGREQGRTETDTRGVFQFDLFAGRYVIKVLAPSMNSLPTCEEKEVIVKAAITTPVDISCDTGIR